ncbi:ATP-dependent helicase [Cohnella endophytica]|uniref:DNA 3'-5' helicase n=1 Tax=Cohnella endophytica TaxID=2419778 RepID=A0A494Y3P7_9BACL|nr:ATP-dependent helicase [Cohnella endophytica]RKP55111.1 ATP-dependent helicase [Cohnella endophytica]
MKTTTFFERKYNELGVELNEVQREAAMHAEGPLLLLASPGSGKTTTLIMRIGYLIEEKGVRPSRIKAVTFSRASAQDMKERFARFFPALAHQAPDFSTIHSFAFEVLRDYYRGRRIAYRMIENPNEPGAEKLNKPAILRDIFRKVNHDYATDDQMEELTSYISLIKNKLLEGDRLSEAKCDVPKAADIYKEYERFKQSGTPELLVDYDDMLTIANEALTQDAELLRGYQNRYDYVMTDESQDTSLVQHAIIANLVQSHGNLCVVADDDQSIYAWRAAEPQYLLDFKNVYPNASMLKMEQNYRSTPNIVDVANRFIKRNKNRYDKNMFTRNPSHSPIAITELPDYRVQAKYVVEKIADGDPEDLGEVAVLYRNNSSSIMLMNALDRMGIPFYMKDGDNRFFSHWIVEDVLNFMRMTFNDKRPDILERIHTKLNCYITKQQMAALSALGPIEEESVFDALLQHVPLQEYQIKQLEAAKTTFAQLKGAKPLMAIQTVRDKLGYDKALDKMCERMGFRKEYLSGILSTLEEIAEPLDSMEAFAARLKELERNMKQSKFNKAGNAVTLSTFHSSKGLEFRHVYMIDLIDGIIPSADDRKKEEQGRSEEMEEAVRLFYVGMTRAKQRLELLYYKKKDGDNVQPSPFVTEVRHIQDPPKEIAKAPVKLSSKKAKELKAQIPPNPNAIRELAGLTEGREVRHRVFGTGEIVRLDGDSIEIRFGTAIKRLSANICVDMGLLE